MSGGSGASHTDLILALVDGLNAAAEANGIDSLDVTVDDPLENYLGVTSSLPSQPEGIRGEVIVYRDISWIADEFDQIKSLERWFPRHDLRVPISIIEVTEEGSEAKSEDYFRSFDWEEDIGKHVLGCIASSKEFAIYDPDTPTGEDPFRFTEHKDSSDMDIFINEILNHGESITRTELAESIEIDDLISTIEPVVFHLEEVLNAYDEERTGILIVLLHVYFENYARTELDDRMQELKSNERAGNFYSDWNFKSVLNACRFMGIVEDREYTIMEKISDARNDYAHDLTAFDTEHISIAEEEGKVEDAIELYEELTGIERSIRSD